MRTWALQFIMCLFLTVVLGVKKAYWELSLQKRGLWFWPAFWSNFHEVKCQAQVCNDVPGPSTGELLPVQWCQRKHSRPKAASKDCFSGVNRAFIHARVKSQGPWPCVLSEVCSLCWWSHFGFWVLRLVILILVIFIGSYSWCHVYKTWILKRFAHFLIFVLKMLPSEPPVAPSIGRAGSRAAWGRIPKHLSLTCW